MEHILMEILNQIWNIQSAAEIKNIIDIDELHLALPTLFYSCISRNTTLGTKYPIRIRFTHISIV